MSRKVRIEPRFWLFTFAVLLFVFGVSCAVAQVRYVQASNHIKALELERHTLATEVNALSARLDYVRTDAYVERVARDELNMIRPGEIRYVSN